MRRRNIISAMEKHGFPDDVKCQLESRQFSGDIPYENRTTKEVRFFKKESEE